MGTSKNMGFATTIITLLVWAGFRESDAFVAVALIVGIITAVVLTCWTYNRRSENRGPKELLNHKPPTLIGLRGKFGVGKDTAAAYIVNEYALHGIYYEMVPFAGPLKRITAIVTSTTDESQYTREGKASIPRGLENSVGYYQQAVGQTMREIIHKDVWVRIALYHPAQYKIIPDVRHPNEVKAIEDAGGIVISITRPGVVLNDGRDVNHISETALDNYAFNHGIENTGTLEDLKKKILDIVKQNAE